MEDKIRICTYNCRSVRNSQNDVYALCNTRDLVLLQEHWLLPHELTYLSSLHPDFYAIGCSAVNVTDNVLKGRPYGGTAILYNKKLANAIKPVDSPHY